MRFSALHLLLFGTAFAAPSQDVFGSTTKRLDPKSLVALGLVPILPCNPVVTVPKPKPVTPKPSHPKTPDGADGLPPSVRPSDPANPSTNPVIDTPGLIPNHPPTLPVDAPNAPVVQPGQPGAPQPNRPGTSKEVLEALLVAEDSIWATEGIEKNRVRGYQAHKKLDEAIDGNILEKGFKGDPNTKYNPQSNRPAPDEMPKEEYLKDRRWEGAFDFTQEGAAI